jgi:hypothetical protein
MPKGKDWRREPRKELPAKGVAPEKLSAPNTDAASIQGQEVSATPLAAGDVWMRDPETGIVSPRNLLDAVGPIESGGGGTPAASDRIEDADANTSVDTAGDDVTLAVPNPGSQVNVFFEGNPNPMFRIFRDGSGRTGLAFGTGLATPNAQLTNPDTARILMESLSAARFAQRFNSGGTPSPSAAPAGYIDFFAEPVGSAARLFGIDQAGIKLGPFGDFAGDLIFTRNQWGAFSCGGRAGANVFENFCGFLAGQHTEGNAGASTVNIDSGGRYFAWPSGAVSGNDGGFQTHVLGRRNTEIKMMVKFRLPTTTSVRMFIGLSDQSLATMVGADSPAAGNFIGLQFSTPRSDANWQTLRRATTTTVGNTGVAVDALAHYLVIWTRPSIAEFALYNSSFTQQYYTALATQLPAAATDLALICAVETQTSAARQIDTYYGNVMASTA